MEIIRFFKKMKHLWRMRTSAEYRDETIKRKGELIWKRLDCRLPNAEGITNKDRVRLRMFERLVKELSLEERKALSVWIACQLKDLRNNFDEHSSGREEEIERKHWQIYSSHQEVVLKWLP